jgi:hypothetical protein
MHQEASSALDYIEDTKLKTHIYIYINQREKYETLLHVKSNHRDVKRFIIREKKRYL